jgi:hypothetical protein
MSQKTYQIKGLPVPWVACPHLVSIWLKQLKIEGEKVGDKIIFKTSSVIGALRNLKVPHVAEFVEKFLPLREHLCFKECDCQQITS